MDASDLSEAQKTELNAYLDETGVSGAWLARKYDDEFREMIQESEVDSDLDDLDYANTLRIRNLQNRGVLDDEDVRQLLRVIDEGEDIETGDVRTALKRAEMVGEDHEIQGFMSAKKANDEFVARKKAEDVEDPQPPHKEDSIVIEYETRSSQTLYRLWDSTKDKSRMFGEWTTIEREVTNADGFDELNERLASPAEYDYDSIARVDVEEGTTIRISTAGENWGQKGQGVQTLLKDRVPSSNWTPLDGLSEVGE